MGYGQYTEGTRHTYPYHPEVGRRTKRDMLTVADMEVGMTYPDGTKVGPVIPGTAKLWGHNRLFVQRAHYPTAHHDYFEWRLHLTPIVVLYKPLNQLLINTGGWLTPTTSAAIREALDLAMAAGNPEMRGGHMSYWHSKKDGGCVLCGHEPHAVKFGTWATVVVRAGIPHVIKHD